MPVCNNNRPNNKIKIIIAYIIIIGLIIVIISPYAVYGGPNG